MVRSRIVYTSSAILRAWYNFPRRERFYGNLMPLRTKNSLSAQYFLQIWTKFLYSRQIFIIVPTTKFHVTLSSGSCADTCGWTDTQTDGRPWRGQSALFATTRNRRMNTEVLKAEFGLLRHILWSELKLRRNGSKWRWHRAVRRVRHVASSVIVWLCAKAAAYGGFN